MPPTGASVLAIGKAEPVPRMAAPELAEPALVSVPLLKSKPDVAAASLLTAEEAAASEAPVGVPVTGKKPWTESVSDDFGFR